MSALLTLPKAKSGFHLTEEEKQAATCQSKLLTSTQDVASVQEDDAEEDYSLEISLTAIPSSFSQQKAQQYGHCNESSSNRRERNPMNFFLQSSSGSVIIIDGEELLGYEVVGGEGVLIDVSVASEGCSHP